jgi:hypothetical protein
VKPGCCGTLDREYAVAILMELAQCDPPTYSLMMFYDDDIDFVCAIQKRLGTPTGKKWMARLTRVTRRLVRYDVLTRKMRGTLKEYVGEPTKQMEYSLDRKYCQRLAPDLYPHYTPMGNAAGELAHILRHAYPENQE